MYKPEEIQERRLKEGENTVDLSKLISRVLDSWPWFLLSIFLCLLAAFIYTRYTPPLYRINARVLVNDQQKGGALGKQAGALMDLGGLMGAQSSVDNEAEVLKTPDLIEEVVRQMELNIVYSQNANLFRRELYQAPFKLRIIKPVDTIQITRLDINKVAGNKIRVVSGNFDRVLSWNQSFHIEGVGELKLLAEPGLPMTSGDYFVTVSSVDEQVTNMMDQLTVKVSNKQVSIVDMTLNYPVEKKGEEILSALISKYKQSNLDEKNAIADSTYTFIEQRLNVIASELGDVENKVETFKRRNNLSDMSEQGRLLVQSTSAISDALAQAETQVSILKDLESYLKDETRNKRVFPTSLMPSDLVFSNLMNQYNSLLAERDRTLMSVTEATPFVQNLNKQIEELRKGILVNIQNTKNTYLVSRNNLQKQLNEAQGKISGVPGIEKNYLKLARNQKIKEELYIFLMQKAEETAISKTSNISIAKVIAKPKAEVFPVSPKKRIVYLLGLIMGFIIPLMTIFTKDFFNTSVTTKDDITNATRVPIVGEISHSLTHDNLIVSNNGRSAIAEQFRALRSNLSFYLKNNEQNVLLLTSSMSGEGKSFTAINLANVLALLGKKVLLMELDLRKPGLSNKLNVANNLGFSNYVINESVQTADIIKPLAMSENLFIITSGLLPPNPIELLMSDRAAQLMKEVKAQFDYIIMDAPPIGVIADAQALADYAQVTLYLVRQRVTQKGQLSIVDQLYASGKMKNLGIVVNDVVDKSYGFGYGYGTYGQTQELSFFEKLWKKIKR